MADKYLIINADDFGMCRAHNEATKELFSLGAITSATVMAPCPFARDAVDFACRNPELSVGVHLTTTAEWESYRWGAISGGVPSLLDSDGAFYRSSRDFAMNARIDEVEAELIAQIEYLLSLGLRPSHLDNHMGSLYGIETGNFSFLKLLFDISARYSLPLRFPSEFCSDLLSNGIINIKIPGQLVDREIKRFASIAGQSGVFLPDRVMPGDWRGEQDKSYGSYRDYIFDLYSTFDTGVTETYIHPAIECDEIKEITPMWHRRVWEHRLFSDPKTKEYISSLGIELIGYRDLKRIRA